MEKYDFAIIGSGLFGSVFARYVSDIGKSVIMFEKRDHIGGNCYDEIRDNIPVSLYGPHSFHCPDKKTWDYVNKFSQFNNFMLRPKVKYNDKIYSFPINLMTLHQLWGVNTPEEAELALDKVRIPCENPRNLEEWILSQVGEEIYETFIRHYTTRQWNKPPSELPASIIKRLPIRLIFNDSHYPDSHIYQGVPVNGYAAMFNKMLEGIEIHINSDFFLDRRGIEAIAETIVYTGPLDELFGHCHGPLEYRSLRFEHEKLSGDYQGTAIVNYTGPCNIFTRISEWKHFYGIKSDITHITREYPAEYSDTKEAYYPLRDDKNTILYKKYRDMADQNDNLILGGRLAEYTYMDMNMVVASAMSMANNTLWSRMNGNRKITRG